MSQTPVLLAVVFVTASSALLPRVQAQGMMGVGVGGRGNGFGPMMGMGMLTGNTPMGMSAEQIGGMQTPYPAVFMQLIMNNDKIKR